MNHEIICEDCEIALQKFEEQSIDLIVTDIPYGINYKSNKQNYDTRGIKPVIKKRPEFFEKIEGDKEIPLFWLTEAYRVLKEGSAIYIFCHWSKWHLLYPAVEEVGFKPKNMIVLNKSNHGMGDLKGSYAPKHELLLFASKGRHILNFPKKRMRDIWDAPVKFSGAKRFHPNEKPISWLLPCIQNSSKKDDVILDPFAGSGSTGVTCKALGRNSIQIDSNEEFCQIAKERLNSDI
jgi:site-specific DNA-methyltransferase (adenine-specific)